MEYKENDLYDGMTLYWGKGVMDKEVYIWDKSNATVTSRNGRPCKGYTADVILKNLNKGLCSFYPKGAIYPIFN